MDYTHRHTKGRARKALAAVLALLFISTAVFALIGLPTVDSYTFTRVSIETGAETVGIHSSLVLDSTNHPHIAYYAATGGLHYSVQNDDGSWSVQTVDSTSGAGYDCSLRLDANGIPHIAYVGSSSAKYATWNGTGWDISTIQSGASTTSLALDASGVPYVSYRDTSTNELRCAWWNGVSWTIEIADNLGATYTAASRTSIQIDGNGHPGIAYASNAGTNRLSLMYANRSASGTWTVANTVDYVAYAGTNYNVRGSISLAFDSHSNPHIAYCRADGTSVYCCLGYAYWTGSAWTSTDIYNPSECAGYGASLVLDANDKAHIVHMVWNLGIHYITNAGGSWVDQKAADMTGAASSTTTETVRFSIALNSFGYPCISAWSKYSPTYVSIPQWSPHWTTTPATMTGVNHVYTYAPAINETGTITATTYPYWLTWDGSTFTGTPTTLGTWSCSITAQSTNGMGTIKQDWTVTVEGWRSSFTTNPKTTAVVGHAYSYTPGTNESATITLAVKPDWMIVDGGTLTGTPTQAGSWDVSIKAVSTNGLLTAYQNFSIQTGEWAPAWMTTPANSAVVDDPYSFTAQTNETGTISADNVPSWLTWTAANSTLWGTPTTAQMGSAYAVALSATGEGNKIAYLNWTITVYDRARWMPTISSAPADTVEVDQLYSYTIFANESVTVTYSGPSWLVLDGTTLSGTAPSAPQSAHISLAIKSDAGTLTYWQNWTITVTAEPPIIVDPPQTTSKNSGDAYGYDFGGAGWGSDVSPGSLHLSVDTDANWLHYGANNGTIWGTPYVPGTYAINATVTNVTTGLASYTNYTVEVSAEAPIVTGTSGAAYNRTESGEGFTDTVWTGQLYSYSLTPSPERCTLIGTTNAGWLHWTAANNTFWGVPTVPGTFWASVAAYDPLTTLTSWSNWTVEVKAPPPAISSGAEFTALVNASWSYVLQYSPADALVKIDFGPTSWISYDASTHTFSGTPKEAGSYAVTVTVTNATTGLYATQTITVTVDLDAPVLVCNPPKTAEERTLYRWTASADQAVSWGMMGDAGSWLTIDAKSGRVTGTPTRAGEYHITIYATNARGVASTYSYNLTVAEYGSSTGGSGSNDSGVINLPGGITIPTGGTATYSTSVTAPVIGLFIVLLIVLLLFFRRRRNGKE